MNEEPIAICEANFTQKEFVRMFAYRMYRNPYVWFVNILTVLLCLLFLLLWVGVSPEEKGDALFRLVNQLFFIILFNGAVYVASVFKYRQKYSILPQNCRMQTVFFEDRAEKWQNGIATTVLYYQNIKKIRHHKGVQYLVFPSLVWLMVPDDKFIQGNWEVVESAILAKKRK